MTAIVSSLVSLLSLPYPRSTFSQISCNSGREYLTKFRVGALPAEMCEALTGFPLVDLGCGRAFGYMAQFARLVGASEYRGVDLKANEVDRYTPEGMRMQVARREMLDYLRTLPDGRVNITINAIDYFIVGDLRWTVNVAREIARVTRTGGIVCGVNALPLILLQGQFEKAGVEGCAQRVAASPRWKVLEGFWHDPNASCDLLNFGILRKMT